MAWQNNWCARGWAFGSRVLAYGMQMRKDEKIVLVRISMEFHYTSCVPEILVDEWRVHKNRGYNCSQVRMPCFIYQQKVNIFFHVIANWVCY
jgi:hypothetical protein